MSKATGVRTVLVPGGLAKEAAISAGLPPTTGISALLRIAAAMFLTGNLDSALERTDHKRNVRSVGSLSREKNHKVSGYLSDLDAELADIPNKSAAIRTGLAMMIGWDKEEAEVQQFVPSWGGTRKKELADA
jgi:hypothetical protein